MTTHAQLGQHGQNQDWITYDECAEWCAKRGLKGQIGDPLPNLLPATVCELINADPEAFKERVRMTAHALAMANAPEY